MSAVPIITAAEEKNSAPDWTKIYIDYLTTSSDSEYYEYALLDIDGDSIPEIYEHSKYSTGYKNLIWIFNDELKTQRVGNSLEYVPGENIFITTSVQAGVQSDFVYEINGTSLKELHSGMASRVITGQERYKWDGVEVSESEYNVLRDSSFDFSASKLVSEYYSAIEIIDVIDDHSENGNQYVTDAMRVKYTNPYNQESVYEFSFPKILIDSTDANKVNEELLAKYKPWLDKIEDEWTAINLDYSYCCDNGVLSVVVKFRYFLMHEYDIYNFDVATGKLLDTDKICQRFNKNYEKIITEVKENIKDIFEKGSYPDSYLDYSLTKENLSYTRLYLENGRLFAMYRVNLPAGTDFHYYSIDITDGYEETISASGLEVYSNYTNLTVELGDTIQIGAGLFKNGSQVTDVSKVTCSVYDTSIISVNKTNVKDNCRFYEFNTHSVGTTYVTFSDSNTGYTKRVPVTVYSTKKSAYTVSNIPTVRVGDHIANFYNSNGLYIDNYRYSTASDGKTTVEFDVYNHNYIYGVVEVYNSKGILSDAVVIDKMTNLKGSIKETVWDGPYFLIEDIIEGDLFSYRESISSKHTHVEITIPKDGYIKITTDTINSSLVALLNGIDIAMSLRSAAGEIKGFDTNSKKYAEKITKEIVNNAIYSELAKDENKFAKDLMKGTVKKTTIFSTKSLGNFVDSFINNLGELKLEELIFDTAVDFGWSTSENLFQDFSGPIGMTMKGLFLAADVANLIIQCKHMDDRMYCGDICIQNQSGGTRTTSQVTVTSDSNFDSDTAFRVYEVAVDSSELESIKFLNPEIYDEIISIPSQMYNISMIKDGKEKRIDGMVEVSIPIPEEMKHLERSNSIKVYRIEEDGTSTEMLIEVRNGNLVFRTDHFSLYVIVAKVFCDSNGDGSVNVKDATTIQKYVAGLITLSRVGYDVSDADGSGKVNVKDATTIQKYVAGIISSLGQPESISLSSSQLIMNVGDKQTLIASITPANSSDFVSKWSSDNSNVASVSNGVVEAKKAGTTTITAKTQKGLTAKCIVTVKETSVNVSGIKLNTTDVTLHKSDSYQLSATVLPENATNKTITWSTSNSSVATVSSSGKITAVSNGKVIITAKASNGITATCAVNVVPVEVSSVRVSAHNVTLYPGDIYSLTATVKPDNAYNKSLTWSSSNTSVATVNSNGTITAKSVGQTTVTVKASNGVYDSCNVTVLEILPNSLSLSTDKKEVDEGQSFVLTGRIAPTNSTNKTITWKSSDVSIATVTQSGQINAVGTGKATITAQTVNGIKAVCEIIVYRPVSGAYELFLNLRKNPNGCYRLTADTTLNTLDINLDTFTGCIDGGGHTITISYDSTSEKVTNNCYKALLPKTDGAIIKNLNISGTIIHEAYFAGSYSNYCAGFVGYAENTIFENCTNEAEIESVVWSGNNSGYGYAGGITAWSKKCTFVNCTNKGNVQALTIPSKVAFSIAGGISGESLYSTFDNCTNSGHVFTHSSSSSESYYVLAYSGGIIGSSNSVELTKCVSSGNIIAHAWPDCETYYTSVAASGGIIAYGNGKLEGCSSSCKLTPSVTNGALVYKGDLIACQN